MRGSELMRLVAGALVLLILGITIWRARDPRNLQWLVGGGNRPAAKSETPGPAKKPEKEPAKKPEPKTPEAPPKQPPESNLYGLTDEDPEQRDAATEEFGAVTDGTTKLGKEEMPVYNRVVYWVKNQTFEKLWQRGRKNPSYSYLFDGAEYHRGEIISLDVTIALVRDAEKTKYDVQLHEAWAMTRQSRDRLYDLIVLDFPDKIPLEKPIREKARFAGYFFKLQGYHSALAKPGQSPELAPMLIGRIDWEPPAAAAAANGPAKEEWTTGMILAFAAGAALLLGGAWLVMRRFVGRRAAPPASLLTPKPGSVLSIDEWLERPESHVEEDLRPEERNEGY